MKAKTIYRKLSVIADRLGVKIIRGKGNFKGGSCVIKEESVIVINSNKPFEDRVKNLALGLLEIIKSIEIGDFFFLENFIKEFKLLPVPEIKTAALTFL